MGIQLVWWVLGGALCGADPIDIGSRLEPFVDDFLIDSMQHAELRLHHPTPRALVWQTTNQQSGKVWGGAHRSVCVFQDGDLYRMYYRDYARVARPWIAEGAFGDQNIVTCYAESRDGIHWTRPELNLYQTEDLKRNNIVWAGTGCANFAVFKDTNPDADPAARYKAIGRVMFQEGQDPAPPQPDATGYPWLPRIGLLAFRSPDGLHWSVLRKARIIKKGEFDSHNVALWDSVRGRYVSFIRIWMPDGRRIRSVAALTSKDFLSWSDPPQWLTYSRSTGRLIRPAPAAAPMHLYDNNIAVYPRAPHLFIGLPMRLVPGRVRVEDNPLREETALNDTGLMTSRDGRHFRRWREAFIRPGSQAGRWWNENCCPAWGFVTTRSHIEGAPRELSFYCNESYGTDQGNLRRYTLRLDGFVSVHAADRGEMRTRPIRFTGQRLVLNLATSAVGSVRVEIQDASGRPIPGFRLSDCPEMFGDAIDDEVRWKSGAALADLTGQAIRLRFVLDDADLYAIQFQQ
ncbi:MAG: hypothetical protein CMJ59_08265 [Planctomycetaceae bacterium]|nr:hypothetical protein [Planctomycetaceae bacterium]